MTWSLKWDLTNGSIKWQKGTLGKGSDMSKDILRDGECCSEQTSLAG